MTSKTLAIGMIGLDTSHATAFTQLLNDASETYHVPGGKVTCAFPGGSKDFEASISRVDGFTTELRDKYGVKIMQSPEEVAENSDAILLESVDGRVHLEQFRKIAPFGKPVFIDKPFSVNSSEADEIVQLAAKYHVPIMSSSGLRYAEEVQQCVLDTKHGEITGADTYGPMHHQPTQPGYFWYGIHSVEMLYTILGPGCVQVSVTSSEDHDVISGLWQDGRIGTVRGNRSGNNQFGVVIHREQGSEYVDIHSDSKAIYATMLEQAMSLFQTGKQPVDPAETLQIIRFLEAANESKQSGKVVAL